MGATRQIGERTVGVQLIESPVDRPQTIANNQTAAVPSLAVCARPLHTAVRHGPSIELIVMRSINGFNSRCLHE